MEAPPLERKLAAIVAADVAGYSRLMEANEEQTLATLSAHRRIIDEAIRPPSRPDRRDGWRQCPGRFRQRARCRARLHRNSAFAG